jgi:chromosome segregation ATPase
MKERNLAGELALLATEVDSLAKGLARANAELARETGRRSRADAEAEELRQELGHARRRAQTAERELGKLGAGLEAERHSTQIHQHELQARLDQALQANEQLRLAVAQKERQRRALEVNLREVMGNLRNAAQEAQAAGVTGPVAEAEDEDATLVPSRPDGIGW